MYKSSITQKGQVTVPAPIRRILDLHTGDQVEFICKPDIILIKKQETDITKAFGLIKAKRSASLEDMQEAIELRGKND